MRNEAEIDATVAYLFANSEMHEPAVAVRRRGMRRAAKRIVDSIGCLGCHVTDNENRAEAGPRRTFGQPLQNIGNKTSYEWLYNWVRDPKHYSPDTYMPDLRLTDAQVADVATYLTTLKGPAGEPAKAKPDAKAADAVLLDYSECDDAGGAGKGDAGEAGSAGEAARAGAPRHRTLWLLQLPRDQGLREGRSRSASSSRKRAAS